MHVQNVKFYIIYLQIIFTEELFIRFFLTKIIYKKKKKVKAIVENHILYTEKNIA